MITLCQTSVPGSGGSERSSRCFLKNEQNLLPSNPSPKVTFLDHITVSEVGRGPHPEAQLPEPADHLDSIRLKDSHKEAIDIQGNKMDRTLFSQPLVQNSPQADSFLQRSWVSLWCGCQLPPSFYKGELKRRIKTHCSQESNLRGMEVRKEGERGKKRTRIILEIMI